ncbi:MAG: asparaginase, partial [Gemmatimonadetes bacterium]|nr:asparaginase [Gemmatimonadota bacterium]
AGGGPGAELGIARKVHDGATRAAEPALVAVLQGLGVLTGEELGELTVWSDAPVTNTRGEQVGSSNCRARLAIGS